MEYKNLGRSGLKVSRYCLGTMNFGMSTNEADAFNIMDQSIEMGINFFDTANTYGKTGWETGIGDGLTEEIIGKWLHKSNNRDKIVLATKVYAKMGKGPNDERLSAYHIRKACEDSLRRLKTDHIDLYQMHHVDRETPWEEIWQAMEQLVREGKIIYTGSSNFSALHIAIAQSNAKERNFMGLISEQSLYNLCKRSIELELIPALKEFGIGLLVWGPLNLGMLAGSYAKEKKSRISSGIGPKPLYDKYFEEVKDQLQNYEEFCKEIGEHPAIIALAWLLKNPHVTAPLIGPRTVEQLKSSMRAFEIKFTEAELKKIDEIWPGPGGEAPEAYAW